jgi:hypothetical protein
MTRTELLTQSSPWFILLCLLVGAAYSYLLYSKEPVWGPNINKSLAVLRFIIVSFLCFLILSPIVKQVKNFIEKPILVVAIDNSESLAEVHNQEFLRKTVAQIKGELKDLEGDLQIEFQTLDNAEISDTRQCREDKSRFN